MTEFCPMHKKTALIENADGMPIFCPTCSPERLEDPEKLAKLQGWHQITAEPVRYLIKKTRQKPCFVYGTQDLCSRQWYAGITFSSRQAAQNICDAKNATAEGKLYFHEVAEFVLKT